ncbi:MAG: nucleotidyltransferase family protein [Phycisphaerae bacterium]
MPEKRYMLPAIEQVLRQAKPHLKRKFKVKKIGIFGSQITGRTHKFSDLDILVEFTSPVDLLEFIALENFLKECTGRKVDLVSRKALRPEFKKQVLGKVVYV